MRGGKKTTNLFLNGLGCRESSCGRRVMSERLLSERRGDGGETYHSMPKPKRTCVAAKMTWVKRKTAARRYGACVGPSTTRRMRERWEMMGKRWRREDAHGLCEARRRRLEARCCELGENFERRTPGRLRRRGTDGIVRFVSSLSSSSSSSSSSSLSSSPSWPSWSVSVGLVASESDGGRGRRRGEETFDFVVFVLGFRRPRATGTGTGTGTRPKEVSFYEPNRAKNSVLAGWRGRDRYC